jgi:L-rhamnose mutarotase
MRYCFALDLIDDPELIAAYEKYHLSVWPEIIQSLADAGITGLEIYRVSNRLFMIMDTNVDFSFEKKEQLDAANEKVQQWEKIMWKYQQALPNAKPGEKWICMNQIFSLK